MQVFKSMDRPFHLLADKENYEKYSTLIKANGGKLTTKPTFNSLICTSKKYRSSFKNTYKLEYITDCIEKEEILSYYFYSWSENFQKRCGNCTLLFKSIVCLGPSKCIDNEINLVENISNLPTGTNNLPLNISPIPSTSKDKECSATNRVEVTKGIISSTQKNKSTTTDDEEVENRNCPSLNQQKKQPLTQKCYLNINIEKITGPEEKTSSQKLIKPMTIEKNQDKIRKEQLKSQENTEQKLQEKLKFYNIRPSIVICEKLQISQSFKITNNKKRIFPSDNESDESDFTLKRIRKKSKQVIASDDDDDDDNDTDNNLQLRNDKNFKNITIDLEKCDDIVNLNKNTQNSKKRKIDDSMENNNNKKRITIDKLKEKNNSPHNENNKSSDDSDHENIARIFTQNSINDSNDDDLFESVSANSNNDDDDDENLIPAEQNRSDSFNSLEVFPSSMPLNVSMDEIPTSTQKTISPNSQSISREKNGGKQMESNVNVNFQKEFEISRKRKNSELSKNHQHSNSNINKLNSTSIRKNNEISMVNLNESSQNENIQNSQLFDLFGNLNEISLLNVNNGKRVKFRKGCRKNREKSPISNDNLNSNESDNSQREFSKNRKKSRISNTNLNSSDEENFQRDVSNNQKKSQISTKNLNSSKEDNSQREISKNRKKSPISVININSSDEDNSQRKVSKNRKKSRISVMNSSEEENSQRDVLKNYKESQISTKNLNSSKEDNFQREISKTRKKSQISKINLNSSSEGDNSQQELSKNRKKSQISVTNLSLNNKENDFSPDFSNNSQSSNLNVNSNEIFTSNLNSNNNDKRDNISNDIDISEIIPETDNESSSLSANGVFTQRNFNYNDTEIETQNTHNNSKNSQELIDENNDINDLLDSDDREALLQDDSETDFESTLPENIVSDSIVEIEVKKEPIHISIITLDDDNDIEIIASQEIKKITTKIEKQTQSLSQNEQIIEQGKIMENNDLNKGENLISHIEKESQHFTLDAPNEGENFNSSIIEKQSPNFSFEKINEQTINNQQEQSIDPRIISQIYQQIDQQINQEIIQQIDQSVNQQIDQDEQQIDQQIDEEINQQINQELNQQIDNQIDGGDHNIDQDLEQEIVQQNEGEICQDKIDANGEVDYSGDTIIYEKELNKNQVKCKTNKKDQWKEFLSSDDEDDIIVDDGNDKENSMKFKFKLNIKKPQEKKSLWDNWCSSDSSE
ncbi:putative uncharacterized protein DDB_G0282133 [Leptopilina boulardi]|uniref:putative uncharacterized protein DDB_G0282133 n=1 Tax=Leptopilina boulardi TaxID=63433 RepID=UPI0021F579BD|nr:putative uncharacterized protein DDB_G0282133 [Leptopilina boulardi]